MRSKLKIGKKYTVQAKSFGVMGFEELPELFYGEEVLILDFPDNSSAKLLRLDTGEEIVYPTISGLGYVLHPSDLVHLLEA